MSGSDFRIQKGTPPLSVRGDPLPDLPLDKLKVGEWFAIPLRQGRERQDIVQIRQRVLRWQNLNPKARMSVTRLKGNEQVCVRRIS